MTSTKEGKSELPEDYNHAKKAVRNEKGEFVGMVPFYVNPDPKPCSKEQLLVALKEVKRKHEEDRREQGEAIAEALAGGPHYLIEYLRRVSYRKHTEFRVVVREDRTAYIHPMNQDGETLDFKI